MPLAFILVMAIITYTAWETLRVNDMATEASYAIEADTIAFNMLGFRHHLQLAAAQRLAPASMSTPMTAAQVAAIRSFLTYSGPAQSFLGGLTPTGQDWFEPIDGVDAMYHNGQVILYYDPPAAGYKALGLQQKLLGMTQGSFTVGVSENGGPTGRRLVSAKLNTTGIGEQRPLDMLYTALPSSVPAGKTVFVGGTVNPLEERKGACYTGDVFSYAKAEYTDVRYRFDFTFDAATLRPTLQTTPWQRDTGASTAVCPLLP